jgi:hypothetical protein
VIKQLSTLSFFVYFIHIVVLEVLWRSWLNAWFQQSQTHIAETVWFDPLFFFLVAGISFAIGYVLHKIPKLAKIVG